jgi:hypothetical protein
MMKTLLTAAALLTFTTAAFADSTFDRSIATSAQPDVYVSTGSGSIRITPSSSNQVHIIGHVHAGWSAFGNVDGRITKIVENPPISQSGNSIHIGDSPERSFFNNITIDYEISVPANAALNLRSGSGDVETNNVGRFLTASSGSGNVRAHGLHGAATLDSGSGDIELEEQAPGDVHAKTGSGSIRIHGLDGALYARTGSGDIEAEGHIQGPANVSSGSGDVRLHLNPDSRFTVEAATGSGDIHVRFPGAPKEEDDSRHHLSASINGGGSILELHTGSGDIEIVPR